MIRYDLRPVNFPHTLIKTSRAARLTLMLGLAVALGGCAASPTQPTGLAYERETFDDAWASRTDDPIGMLVAQKSRRAPGNISYPGSATADNSVLAGTALRFLGIRYRYGGSSPTTGFDCSGLVAYAAAQSLGLKLPRNAAEIYQVGAAVDRAELAVGDLVFFNTMGRRYSHVGIYVGDGRFVHSPSAGGVVRVDRMEMAYWNKRYNGARRIDPTLVASAASVLQR